MFIALLINPILCFYHIIIHSLFKSILFLLAGSLIHIQYNYQNIYQIKMNYKAYWITHLLTSNILILSLSKEIIIHNIFLFINSPFSFYILNLGAVFTTPYTLKIYMYCFWIYNLEKAFYYDLLLIGKIIMLSCFYTLLIERFLYILSLILFNAFYTLLIESFCLYIIYYFLYFNDLSLIEAFSG